MISKLQYVILPIPRKFRGIRDSRAFLLLPRRQQLLLLHETKNVRKDKQLGKNLRLKDYLLAKVHLHCGAKYELQLYYFKQKCLYSLEKKSAHGIRYAALLILQ